MDGMDGVACFIFCGSGFIVGIIVLLEILYLHCTFLIGLYKSSSESFLLPGEHCVGWLCCCRGTVGGSLFTISYLFFRTDVTSKPPASLKHSDYLKLGLNVE